MNKYLIAIIIFFGCSLPALADTDNLYQVEVIIFENRQLTQADIEKWPDNPALPQLKDAKQLTLSEKLNLIPYQLLPASQLTLIKEAANIAHDPNYNLLLHVSWLQPLSNNTTTPVHLYSQDNFTDVHELQPYDENKKWKLNGVIAIRKSKYYEIAADLILNKLKPSEANKGYMEKETSSETLIYRLKQNRRTREDELQYIDNPVFGVLIKITPATKVVSAVRSQDVQPSGPLPVAPSE